jgi:hypothetical protein
MKPILNSQFSILNSFAIILAFLVTSAFAGPVSHYGALKVCKVGNKGQLCGSNPGTTTTPVFVKGPSLYWSVNPGNVFYNLKTVDWLVNEMEMGVIRAAMAIRYWSENKDEIKGNVLGYAQNKDGQKAIIKGVIEAAIANDIYVIVDWHSHNAHNSDETSLATTFFRELATEYKNTPNIIWEIYNEPVNANSTDINSYTTTIYNAIRNAGSNNLILVGSNWYSQKPYEQAQKFGKSDDAVTKNVGFTFHFYAASHSFSTTDGIGKSANDAMNAGYAVFGTEWGSMNADGKGSISTSATSAWTSWMDDNNISNCAWQAGAVCEKGTGNPEANQANCTMEISSMFSLLTSTENLATSRLTQNGTLIKSYVGNNNRWSQKLLSNFPNHPKGNDLIKDVRDGEDITLTTDLGLNGNITDVSQPEFGTISNTANSITYTTLKTGSSSGDVRFIYKITKDNITVQRRVILNIINRRPSLKENAPIVVSRRAPTYFALIGTLGASNPGGAAADMSFNSSALSLSDPSFGTISVMGNARDSLVFTPSESQYNTNLTNVTLNYAVQNTNGSSYASVDLQIKNNPPTINPFSQIYCCFNGAKPNTDPIAIGMEQVNGVDKDGDPLKFVELYLDAWYPGRLEKVTDASYIYYPDASKTGKVVFLAVITDGFEHSSVGKSYLTLNGNGSAIGNHPSGANGPISIPGYESPVVVSKPSFSHQGLSIKSLGSGRVVLSFAESGFAKLDVYSLSGKNMGTLLSGHQNAGDGEVSLSKLGLQKGVYILRLRQGSQVKTLRIVN